MRSDNNKFGVFVSVWMEEMTMVSIANTRTADPRSSPMDARQSFYYRKKKSGFSWSYSTLIFFKNNEDRPLLGNMCAWIESYFSIYNILLVSKN